MKSLIVFLVITAIAALFAQIAKGKKSKDAPPYIAAGPLLTDGELHFFHSLAAAVSANHYVFAKVRLLDIIEPKKGMEPKTYNGAKNKISQKHADFVICDRASMKPLVVIELNDRSHERSHRQARDRLVSAALGAAGIPLHFVPAQKSYDTLQLRALLLSASN